MNTERGNKAPPPDRPAVRFKVHGPTEVDAALERATKQLEQEKERIGEERFFWICALLIVVDLAVYPSMQTWAGPLSLTFLQFLFLVPLGRRLGVDSIWTITEKLLDKWDGRLK